MNHPDDQVLIAVLDGITSPTGHLADHLATCPTCRQHLDALAREAATWRAALRLTSAERALLTAADLPARLIAASRAGHHRAALQASARHLLFLLGGCLLVALGWVLLDPLLTPALTWASRLIDLPTLGLTVASQLAIPVVLALVTFPAVPALALTRDLLPLVALLLLTTLLLHRRRGIASPSAA
jgi:predicted anti-sigma-YlaC factor YlaD